MNALLIATQGVSGGSLAMAVQGFSTIADVVVVPIDPAPYVPGQGGGSRVFRGYYSPSRERYELPIAASSEAEDEEVIIAILLEVARYEL